MPPPPPPVKVGDEFGEFRRGRRGSCARESLCERGSSQRGACLIIRTERAGSEGGAAAAAELGPRRSGARACIGRQLGTPAAGGREGQRGREEERRRDKQRTNKESWQLVAGRTRLWDAGRD